MRSPNLRRPSSNPPEKPATPARPRDERPATLTEGAFPAVWSEEVQLEREESDEGGTG